MTKQKAAVMAAMCMAEGHHTAEEIFALAKTLLPAISRATVYNNLHAMQKEGSILCLHTDGVADRYDANPTPHGHIICEMCGGICDLTWDGLTEELERRMDGPAVAYELNVRTVCARCNPNFVNQ